jgi:hypothetical protein
MFLGFIFAIFGIEYARRKYLETKNKNEGFSKATENAKMFGQVTLFIILTIIFYVGAYFIGSGLAGGGPNPALLGFIGALIVAPPTLAYYLAFVLIK